MKYTIHKAQTALNQKQLIQQVNEMGITNHITMRNGVELSFPDYDDQLAMQSLSTLAYCIGIEEVNNFNS